MLTDNDEKNKIREKEGVITAAAGLLLNLILGGIKLAFGLITGSLSIMSDAVNNLSDVGTSAVTVSSFVISGKKADREHPYGHGRFEYVAAFVVSALVLIVGAELLISSVKSLFSGDRAEYSLPALIVLIISIAVKFVMGMMYFIRNKSVKSDTLKAACFDSFSDCAVTTLVAVSFIASGFTDFPVDAACGIAASGFIIFGGLKIVLSTVNRLLGCDCGDEVEKDIAELVKSEPLVLGVHDLMVHDYGAAHKVASVDAEFDKNLSFIKVHDAVDRIERAAYFKYNINLVVHSDPVDVSDARFVSVRRAVISALEPYGRDASFHELCIADEQKTIRLHLKLSEKLMKEREHILSEVIESVSASLPGFTVDAEYDFM
ncbi:MAG: cation diffusion facilitator family transporter [Christensenellales bacterium]